MAVPYKHTCSICKKLFFSSQRSHNICSGECRSEASKRKIKKYRKCIVCGWDATVDVHHENGNEYDLCPNHHSLLTRGKQNLEEVLAGIVNLPKQPRGYICPIIDFRPRDHNDCPIINGTHKFKKTIKYASKFNFYDKLKGCNLTEFTYRDVAGLLSWKIERVKKHVLILFALDKIAYKSKSIGGRGRESLFVFKDT